MANIPVSATAVPTTLVDLLCTDELRHIVQHADAQSLLALCQVGGQLATLSLARMNPAQQVFYGLLMDAAEIESDNSERKYYFYGLPCDVIAQIFGHLST